MKAIQGLAGDVHLAFGAAGQGGTALLRNDNSVLGVVAAEVVAHGSGCLGLARAIRHMAFVSLHLPLSALLRGRLWHGFAVGDWRAIRGWRGKGE